MSRYLDISVPVDPRTLRYPDDPPTQVSWPGWSHAKGDPANVGFFEGSLHVGTHADAPWHFIPEGARIEEVPLDQWVGPCWVTDQSAAGVCVDAAALDQAGIPPGTTRLLIKTRNSQSAYWHEPWRVNFIYLAASAATWCVERGIRTVGFDYLTIDPESEPDFPAHRILLGRGAVIIECLNLREIAEGSYELIAAPVTLQGTDAAWVRALLREDPK